MAMTDDPRTRLVGRHFSIDGALMVVTSLHEASDKVWARWAPDEASGRTAHHVDSVIRNIIDLKNE